MSAAFNLRTATRIAYTVEGRWPFPTDMLRRDGAKPASVYEAGLIEGLSGDMGPDDRCALRRIHLISEDVRGAPLTARWESFGWRVVECDDDLRLSVTAEKMRRTRCRNARVLLGQAHELVRDARGTAGDALAQGDVHDLATALACIANVKKHLENQS